MSKCLSRLMGSLKCSFYTVCLNTSRPSRSSWCYNSPTETFPPLTVVATHHLLSSRVTPSSGTPSLPSSTCPHFPRISTLALSKLQNALKTSPGCQTVSAMLAIAIIPPSRIMKGTSSLASLPLKPVCNSATRKQDRTKIVSTAIASAVTLVSVRVSCRGKLCLRSA